MSKDLKPKTRFWTFIEYIKRKALRFELDVVRIANGVSVTRQQGKTMAQQRIEKANRELLAGGTVEAFIKHTRYLGMKKRILRTDEERQQQVVQVGNETEAEETDDVQPHPEPEPLLEEEPETVYHSPIHHSRRSRPREAAAPYTPPRTRMAASRQARTESDDKEPGPSTLQSTSDKADCVVCYSASVNKKEPICLFPCGYTTVCLRCVTIINSSTCKHCPICRTEIVQ
ncbi:uncharacterized protein LOC123507580 isoform X2 [Portunus trituberculatus]|uniref:uncharacterized protein LOC123507580 isoform X2 n=1 Tax=Portunus trituberculatus TaxID=210409 RepID=UPI001E1CDE93|nr:uncharacterized protein LOC123507580 isoform X2 [Portunus trituberculatus]